LGAVDAALRRVEQGETAAVFVTGGSGVGKTELMRVIAARMREAGAVVFAGICLDIGDISLHPVRHALRRFLAESNRATTAAAGAATDLITFLDGEAASPTSAGALIERTAAGLRAVSEGQPLVLVIDDLHWVDQSTERLLRYLLAGLGGIRLLLVGAARVEALHGRHPVRTMLSELRRQPSVLVMELRPLDRAATEELAATIVGRPLDRENVELLWTRSRGNPYVVETLARGYRDGAVGLPTTLREIALAQVAALSPESRAVAYAMAAGVEPVEHALLARVVPLSEEQLIEAVRATVDQRILDADEDTYRFHLGVFKEVLESALLPGERVRLHRRYAEALAELPDGESQHSRLAHHWRLAGERRRAVRSAIAAAERAERLYRFAEAFTCWAIALVLIDEAPAGELPDLDRPAMWRAAAEAAHRSGEHPRALAILEELAAREKGLPGWLHTSRARYLAAAGRPAEAEAEYELAFAAEDCTALERATAGAHSADLLVELGRYAEAGQRARVALDLARAEGDLSSVVLASGALGFSQAYLADPVAGRAAVEEALSTAEQAGSPADIACAYLHLADLLTGPLNELRDGVKFARRGAARSEQLGIARTYGARLLAVAANGLFRLGEWAEAETCIDHALRHGPSGTEAVELLLARCRVSIGYGDLDAAASDLDAIETLTAGASARHVLPLLILRAGLAMWRGEHVEARRAVKRGLDFYQRRTEDIVLQATLLWHGLRAEAEAQTASQGADPHTVADLRRLTHQIKDGSVTAAMPVRDAVAGFLALCDAELTRIEGTSDPAAWALAERLWDGRQPYPAAYARLRQAEALFAQRTRNAKAETTLRQAYRAARLLGARPLTEEIKNLADRARVRLDEPVDQSEAPQPTHNAGGPIDGRRHGPLATLTDREYEVLALVAAGLTNQEIGLRLFISPRTVGVHVSHVLAKLQVKSRVQASAIYQRRAS
jgi:DNA-binding CsgD family transcriptional regulator